MTKDLSISDLCSALDWSGTDSALASWQRFNPVSSTNESLDSFRIKFRHALLAYSLPAEITGSLPDESPEMRNAARWALKTAGVWTQVVDWLLAESLIGPAQADQATQLTLNLE